MSEQRDTLEWLALDIKVVLRGKINTLGDEGCLVFGKVMKILKNHVFIQVYDWWAKDRHKWWQGGGVSRKEYVIPDWNTPIEAPLRFTKRQFMDRNPEQFVPHQVYFRHMYVSGYDGGYLLGGLSAKEEDDGSVYSAGYESPDDIPRAVSTNQYCRKCGKDRFCELK